MKKKTKTITVCSSCLTASCFQGIFPCEKYRFASTMEITVDNLEKLNLEHPTYWMEENPKPKNGNGKPRG